MSKCTLYTANVCPYCVRAKQLLKSHSVDFEEIDVSDPNDRNSLVEKANGMKTVPQIFFDDQHIGGCDDLEEFINAGKLNEILEN